MPTFFIHRNYKVTFVVARFEICYQQTLDQRAKLCAPLPEFTNDHEYLIALYRTMVLTRIFDQKAIALQRIGKLGTYPPSYGQEAIATAIGHTMQEKDVFLPYYRDHATQIQRNVQMSEILTYWGGDERGSNFAHNKHDFPICVPIASQCLHAAGVAFAFKYKKSSAVAVVSIGDGGTSEGDFYEALNVAGVWNLPLVFVINNNQWAISVNIAEQTSASTLAQKAIAAGVAGVQVDGNDLLATHQVINDALHKARTGGGPTVIEALTYRLSDHTTADDATRYQPSLEVKDAHKLEPIARFKSFLEQHIAWNEAQEQALISSCSDEVDKAVEKYLQQTPQPISSAFDYHYSYLPDYLIEQRAEAIEEATHV